MLPLHKTSPVWEVHIKLSSVFSSWTHTQLLKVTTEATTNYNAASKTQAFSITKRVLTITASNEAITYGEEFDLTKTRTPKFEGFADNENASVLEGTLVYTTTYQKGNNAGIDKYKISVTGYTSNNYDIVYKDGKLTVNKAKYQIDTTAEGKVYDGKTITLLNETYPTGAMVTKDYQVVGTTSWTSNSLPRRAGTYNIRIKLEETTTW